MEASEKAHEIQLTLPSMHTHYIWQLQLHTSLHPCTSGGVLSLKQAVNWPCPAENLWE
jgi:hypothetical protein